MCRGGEAASFSGIFPEERKVGGSPPWDACTHFLFLLAHGNLSGRSYCLGMEMGGKKRETEVEMDAQVCSSSPHYPGNE